MEETFESPASSLNVTSWAAWKRSNNSGNWTDIYFSYEKQNFAQKEKNSENIAQLLITDLISRE